MSEQTQAQVTVKPLSENAFIAFFQKIWRWWLGVWYGYQDKHPVGAKWIYEIFFFIVFSNGVTIFQMLLLIFLPYLFGPELAAIEFMWPKVDLGLVLDGEPVYWSILGNSVLYNEAGQAVIGGGLGYFLAFKIATFLAQCINLPLQRNITYKSKGNVWYQAMWYFIGWLLLNPACDAVNNLWIPYFAHWAEPLGLLWLKDILAMMSQGGISMTIFFFIFKVIFPDQEKMAQTAEKKLNALKESGASEEKIAAAQLKATILRENADEDKARRDEMAAVSLANAKAVSWNASSNNLAKLQAKQGATEEELAKAEAAVEERWAQAVEAAEKRDQAIAFYAETQERVNAARAARA